MTGESEEVPEDEEEKLKKLKKKQEVVDAYHSAVKADSAVRYLGYDHIEGPDFDRIVDAVNKEYERKTRKRSDEQENEGQY